MQPWLLDGGEVHFELSVYMLRQISFISVDLPKALEASDGYRSKRSSLKDIPCEETEYKLVIFSLVHIFIEFNAEYLKNQTHQMSVSRMGMAK